MNTGDILRTAVKNTFRSRLRTTLTVIAIFIGAFTLSITTAIGAGISAYIGNQLGALGAPDILTVSPTPEDQFTDEGPRPYDPDRAQTGLPGGPPGLSITPLTDDDLDTIAAVDGIIRVDPIVLVTADFIGVPGSERFEITLNPASAASVPDLAAGDPLTESGHNELLLPLDYVDALGFADAEGAVGVTATLGVTDAVGTQHEVDATIVGVQNSSLLDVGTAINQTLTDALVAAQAEGRQTTAPTGYFGAIAHMEPGTDQATIDEIKAELSEEGFTARTTADQIGQFQTVIGGIIGVLNAFAVIALIAAGFGIVNTLLMSVQERTREIGLMKAMGMSSARVFALFSTEAVFIGFLGSAIGAGIAILAGTLISTSLADTLLSGLPGLQIMLFEPLSIAAVILGVMGIAFLAGTLPARRAAVQNPIDALRYE